LGKSGLKPVFSFKIMVVFSKSGILEKPRLSIFNSGNLFQTPVREDLRSHEEPRRRWPGYVVPVRYLARVHSLGSVPSLPPRKRLLGYVPS
jgi:hypothetical protein